MSFTIVDGQIAIAPSNNPPAMGLIEPPKQRQACIGCRAIKVCLLPATLTPGEMPADGHTRGAVCAVQYVLSPG